MLLAVDLGNSSISFGLFDEEETLRMHAKMATQPAGTADEYAVRLQSLLTLHGHSPADIDGIALSSVVPSLTHVLQSALRLLTTAPHLVVGPGIRTGFSIRIDDPSQLGADLAANAAAAVRYYGSPVLIADLGTVNSLSAVDGRAAYLGTILAPGIRVSLDQMHASAAQLPTVSLTPPAGLLGRNTADAIRAGILHGAAIQLDGFIDRLLSELSLPADTPVVATGGLAPLLLPLCRHTIVEDPHLTLRGLLSIWKINRPRKA